MTTWSGYHSRMKELSSIKPRAEIDILALFPDKSFPAISFNDVKYVILIGGLHIEDKAHFICGSGWGVGDV